MTFGLLFRRLGTAPSIVLIIPAPIDRYQSLRSASETVGCMAVLGAVV